MPRHTTSLQIGAVKAGGQICKFAVEAAFLKSTMTDRSGKISIAICGGGIAAVCLAYGLLQHAHLDVKIYEANQILREDGAAVGLGGNAQEALQLLGPEMRAALDKAGGTRMTPSIRYMMVFRNHQATARKNLAKGKSHREQAIMLGSTFSTSTAPNLRSLSIAVRSCGS